MIHWIESRVLASVIVAPYSISNWIADLEIYLNYCLCVCVCLDFVMHFQLNSNFPPSNLHRQS